MCLVLESEVILANLLSKITGECGIDRNDLVEYCVEIKKQLAELGSMLSKYIYFDISTQSINKAIKSYHDWFVQVGDKVFAYNNINACYFNSRFSDEIAKSLEKAAIQYVHKKEKVNKKKQGGY